MRGSTLASQTLFMALAATAIGCNQRSGPSSGPSAAQPPTADSNPQKKVHVARVSAPVGPWDPADAGRGYFHEKSGIGLVVPDQWQLADLKISDFETRLAVTKPDADIASVITLVPTGVDAGSEGLGASLYNSLRSGFEDRVALPEPVEIAGRLGFRSTIAPGPAKPGSTSHAGVAYVFGVERNLNMWVVTIQTHAAKERDLSAAIDLLAHLRINP